MAIFPQLTQSRLFQQTPGSNFLAAWIQLQATPNVETTTAFARGNNTLAKKQDGSGVDKSQRFFPSHAQVETTAQRLCSCRNRHSPIKRPRLQAPQSS